MAVGIRIKLAGVTQAQFEEVDRVVGRGPFDGLIFHASGPIDGGWGVLDFWESREQFDRFVADQIGPAMAQTGANVQPDINEFPVHEYLKP